MSRHNGSLTYSKWRFSFLTGGLVAINLSGCLYGHLVKKAFKVIKRVIHVCIVSLQVCSYDLGTFYVGFYEIGNAVTLLKRVVKSYYL